MDFGKLRHRVSLQRLVQTDDDQGGTTSAWQEIATPWAAVTGTGGREFQTAKQTRATLTDEVTIRYRPGVTASMRIVHGGRVLAIARPPLDPDGLKRELRLFCEEIDGETP